MISVTLDLSPLAPLSDEAFYQICQANPELKLERTAAGELVVMSPTGGETGDRNRRITQRLGNWTDEDNTGLAFDSSTCFRLPNGAERSPDAAWISLERWQSLTREEQAGFPPLAPDFVIELRSPSDNLRTLESKMQEYIDNGVRLGWLIDPQNRRVHIYRPHQPVEIVQSPSSLSGEDVLRGFTLNLDKILD
ncbi:Uma2 family endonuclease [Pleurocapsales cyanobacterium LEGE 06147]|nr:Uma2 family endonuclease [Pleurocapsales cyanobacterium LEGE 06147]